MKDEGLQHADFPISYPLWLIRCKNAWIQVASTNVGDEHAATVWYALHPGGMLAISPGSRSAPGENERPAISDPGGVTAPKSYDPSGQRR